VHPRSFSRVGDARWLQRVVAVGGRSNGGTTGPGGGEDEAIVMDGQGVSCSSGR
jgi:hypothetical protein